VLTKSLKNSLVGVDMGAGGQTTSEIKYFRRGPEAQ
jgi:hypothetical protein